MLEGEVDHGQNRLSVKDTIHSRGELFVAHDVVARAFVDDDTQSVLESPWAAVVVNSGRIDLKEIC